MNQLQQRNILSMRMLAISHGHQYKQAGANQLLIKDKYHDLKTETTRIVWVNVSAWPVERFIKWLGY